MPSVCAARAVSTTSLRWRKKLLRRGGGQRDRARCRGGERSLVESANGGDLDGHTSLRSTEDLDRGVDILVGELCW